MNPLSRRSALKKVAAAAVTAGLYSAKSPAEESVPYRVKNGRIRQSVVPWCFKPMPPEELIRHSAALGLSSVELIDPAHWPLIKELGMQVAIASSHGFSKGFAHREEWAECQTKLRERIEQCAAAGVERVITFSGFRRGLSDEEGIANMVAGLKEIAAFAEQKKVTLCLEMLNSRVPIEMKGHPDYFCDSMERSRDLPPGRLGTVQDSLRSLPRADHARRRDQPDQTTLGLHRPRSHRRRPWAE